MLADSYGNKNSTNSVDAIASYNQGVHQFLGAEPGVEASFRTAISADPNFTLEHIGLAREMQLREGLIIGTCLFSHAPDHDYGCQNLSSQRGRSWTA